MDIVFLLPTRFSRSAQCVASFGTPFER